MLSVTKINIYLILPVRANLLKGGLNRVYIHRKYYLVPKKIFILFSKYLMFEKILLSLRLDNVICKKIIV